MRTMTEAIEESIVLRRDAYKAGDISLGKAIEDELARFNVRLEDSDAGTSWRIENGQ